MMATSEPAAESLLGKKSEDAIATAVDKCLADGLIKMGSGVALGAAFSLILLKRRMWPVTLGFGAGIGAAFSNCRTNMSTSLPNPK